MRADPLSILLKKSGGGKTGLFPPLDLSRRIERGSAPRVKDRRNNEDTGTKLGKGEGEQEWNSIAK